MARTFRRRHSAQPIADLNVTNLIDLGFMLLIIFMVATPLMNQEQQIPVKLPVESKSPQQKPDKDENRFVTVSVDARGRYYLDNAPTALSLVELRGRLKGYAAEAKPPVMSVRGDGEVSYSRIIQLVDELKKANLLKLHFVTESEK